MSDMTAIGDQLALRERYAAPSELVQKKKLTALDAHAKRFIALSPFLTLATCGQDGADCSPRGDAPGFVQVVDDRTIRIPDRRGNNILDSLQNLLIKPDVGLLFFVPGISETLRVNGEASIVAAPDVLQSMAARGIVPAAAIEVKIRQVYFHCGRALIRSELWNPAKQISRDDFPRLGTVIADQIQGVDGDKANANLEVAYTTNLY